MYTRLDGLLENLICKDRLQVGTSDDLINVRDRERGQISYGDTRTEAWSFYTKVALKYDKLARSRA